ncbi:MAG: DUF3108 domain-containing protein, partial [Chromatiales bacterium]|nr:DUF3108 domain-containing protein [Chromatiales bacterium]
PAEHAGSSILKTLFSAFLLLSASTIGATETPYSAFYSLDADGMSIGNLERSLTRTKEEIFVLNTKSYATGFWKLFFDDVIAEESRFTIFKGKVVPQSYLYTKKRKGELSEERLTFNHHKNTILSNSNDGQVNFGFTGVETDKLLYQFMIREALRDGGGERDLDFSVVDKGGVHPYRFKVGAIESLVTNIGTIDAVRVDRINEERRKTTIWFAPSLDYLPVKIVQDAGDHNYSSTIISTSLKR